MKKSKVWIYIGTVLLICTILLAGMIETQGPPFMTAVVGSGEQTEELSCWYDTYTGTVYFFLPGYAELDQVRIRTDHGGIYRIGDQWIEDGMACGGFELDIRYPVSAPDDMLYSGKHLVFAKSHGIAALFLDVQSGDMTYLHEDKNHSEPGAVRVYNENGTLAYSGSVDTVKGRGQSSWEEEKKSYSIRLNQDADLLELGSAKNWVLQANSKDETHLRNKIVMDFAAAAGLSYTPDCQWVDLYLNGEYTGLYLLCEKIEVHPERVAIPEEGSFLLSKDWPWRIEADGKPLIMTEAETALEIRYSDYSQDDLRQQIQTVENAILAEDDVDPVTGKSWQELIDLDSWVRKYLLEEIFGNTDGLTLSQYYYKDGARPDGKIQAGPAWDYDLTMHREYNMSHVDKPSAYGSSWLPALMDKEDFFRAVVETYRSEFRPMLQELLDGGITAYADKIAAAVSMDHLRWYPALTAASLLEKRDEELTAYLEKRVNLYDQIWIDKVPYLVVDAWDAQGLNYFYILIAGSTVSELPQTENMRWHFKDSGHPVDPDQPLYQDVVLYEDALTPKPEATGREESPDADQWQEQDEGFSLLRWLPVLAFGAILAVVVVSDIWMRYRERKTEQRQEKASV